MTKQFLHKKVIIIGAGIAGLAAYKRLQEYGIDATILEARDRCGGRIWTDNNTLGIPFGRGAAWIHGATDNPITKLADKSHAKIAVVDPSKFVIFNQNGIPFSDSETQRFNEIFQKLLIQAKELAFKSKQDISLTSALSSVIKNNNFSSVEHNFFQARQLAFESYHGVNNEFLSARNWDQDETWPGENCFVTSSYQPIIDNLVKNSSIQLNTIVKKINTHLDSVEVITENTTYCADAVIITIPLGVLKKNDIEFHPPLPNDKQKAIQRLGMGLFNITAIKFPAPFWPEENHAFFFSQFDALSIPVFINLYSFIQAPILVGYSGGERARQLENLTDVELIEKTMQNFKKTFGQQLPEPEAYLNTRWSRDPFSYGSYSYNSIGSTSSDYEALAKPVSTQLFFAGEATCSKYPATTHGAYLSGIREADRIKNYFN